MVNEETRSRVSRETVDEIMGIKRKTARLQKQAIAATAAAVAATALGYGAHKLYQRTLPETWEAKNPAMVQAARTGDFHGYDRAAIQTYPGLKKSSPVILKHWDAITNIAGNTYNALAVIETLSRTPGSAEEIGTSIKINEWSGRPRMGRRADILRRAASRPGAGQLFNDLYRLPSKRIEDAREVFYGGKWEYGKLRSGATNAPAFKASQSGRSIESRRYQGTLAKSRLARDRQPRSALIRHQQHRRV